MKPTTAVVALSLLVCLAATDVDGQSCRVQTVTGGSTTSTIVAGYEKSPTATTNADTSGDSSYYEITNALGLGPTPVVRTMYSNWVQTNASNGGGCTNCDPASAHPVYYGATFINPTNSSITITQVDFTSSADHYTPTTITAVTPATGWQPVTTTNRRLVRWIGSIVVPSRSGQDFIFGDSPMNNASNNTTRSVTLNVAMTTSSGTYNATPYAQTALTSNSNAASNAAVSFDSGGAIAVPMLLLSGKTSTAPVSIGIRVGETGNNGASSAIKSGLQLTITIPARWSSVSMQTVAAPWNAATVTIVQPTTTTTGSITVSTNQAIAANGITAANSLVFNATAPISSATNLFAFGLALSGTSSGATTRPISSFNESVVQVLGNGTQAVNAEFLSSTLTGPVRQIAFSTALNVNDGPGGESVDVQVYNNTSSSWETVSTVTPGATNATVTRTFTSDFLPFVSSNRMKVRFVSTGTTVRTLRLDQIRWDVTQGYTVDNSAAGANDANVGDVARPFATVTRGATVVGASGAVYVEVGNSRSGSPYASNLSVSAAGTGTCKTLFTGVASGGLMPLIRGAVASSDWGFDVTANHVTVTGFRVENTNAALIAEAPASNVTFSGNEIQMPDFGFGVVLSNYDPNAPVAPSSNLLAQNNTIDGSGSQPFIGVYDAGSQSSVIDGNKISSVPNWGIYADGSASLTVQRNIVTGNYLGVQLSRTTGALVYNNTIDLNTYRGIYAEGSTVTSRNNIVTNNALGWSANAASSVSSDYDDVYGNSANYSGNVTAGVHSQSVNPSFVQTSNSSLATYYQLGAGSQCIDRGVDVGLTFLGLAPDMGAVESY